MRKVAGEQLSTWEEKELADGLKKAKLILGKIPDQEMIQAVRKTRDQR